MFRSHIRRFTGRLASRGERRLFVPALLAYALVVMVACNRAEDPPPPAEAAATTAPTEATLPSAEPTSTPVPEQPAATAVPQAQSPLQPAGNAQQIPAYRFQIVNTYPHDAGAYTQGLQFVDGQLYEGTGRKGESSLRRVNLETGAVEQQHDLSPDYFGEGITVVGDRIWQLTWQEYTAFLYDRATFEPIAQIDYETEGWGLTSDGQNLIMSDGTDVLYVRDPGTFALRSTLPVRYLGAPLTRLNELEFIDGEVWANIYQTNYIVRIDPDTGNVVGVVDLTGILDSIPVVNPVDVLNGIAYDAESGRILVTGKWWPALFEITLEQAGWAQ